MVGPKSIGVVKVHVRDPGHAAIPGVGRVQSTAQTHLDEGDIEAGLGEVEEDHRGQELELGRIAVSSGDAVRDRDHGLHESRERGGVDRTPIDDDPLAIRDEVRLRRFAHPQTAGTERAPGQREHAALAVGPRDEGAADPELWVAEGLEEGARATESKADAESSAIGEGRECLVVGHRPVTRGTVRPRRRRTD